MKKKYLLACILVGGGLSNASAEVISGIDFLDGTRSFADEYVSYTKGGGVIPRSRNNPKNALGVPNYVPVGGGNSVNLGYGGELVVKFTDNYLITSGDSKPDLWVFELGNIGVGGGYKHGTPEPTAVYISTDGNVWKYAGVTKGGIDGVDIDNYINNGVVLGEKYYYVKLVDLSRGGTGTSSAAGAEIDAIGVTRGGVLLKPLLTKKIAKLNCTEIDIENEKVACYAVIVGPKVCTEAINENDNKLTETIGGRVALAAACTKGVHSIYAKEYVGNDLLWNAVDELSETACQDRKDGGIFQWGAGIYGCVFSGLSWGLKITTANSCVKNIEWQCEGDN